MVLQINADLLQVVLRSINNYARRKCAYISILIHLYFEVNLCVFVFNPRRNDIALHETTASTSFELTTKYYTAKLSLQPLSFEEAKTEECPAVEGYIFITADKQVLHDSSIYLFCLINAEQHAYLILWQ